MGVHVSADSRVSDWPLMSSFWPTISITATYLIVVKLGPSLMNLRPHGFEFRWSLFGFNAALVALNLYICIEVSTTCRWLFLSLSVVFINSLLDVYTLVSLCGESFAIF